MKRKTNDTAIAGESRDSISLDTVLAPLARESTVHRGRRLQVRVRQLSRCACSGEYGNRGEGVGVSLTGGACSGEYGNRGPGSCSGDYGTHLVVPY